MAQSSDYFEEPENHPPVATVEEIRDRFVASGLSCNIERSGNEAKIIFAGRNCYLLFMVNPSGRPLTASMPDTTDYDAEFAHIVFSVFDSVGWKFQP